MKIRNGFVSNSSSSSFTCDVCGNEQCGMDLSMREAGMSSCENGHTMCDSHQIPLPINITIDQRRDWLKGRISKYANRVVEELRLDDMSDSDIINEFDNSQDDGIAHWYCPICQFRMIEMVDVGLYLLKSTGKTKESVLEEIKGKFKNYTEFYNFCKSKES